MPTQLSSHELPTTADVPLGDPCIIVLFGASGDLTQRLLMPGLYNLACGVLLPEQFGVVGFALDEMNDEQFRARMSERIRKFHTQNEFDETAWSWLRDRLHYVSGRIEDLDAFRRLHDVATALGDKYGTGGNLLFYFAVPPSIFGPITNNLEKAGFKQGPGWRRLIVEKPFGHDLASAQKLNREILSHWEESQIYRVDHYLGKDTVQNLLAFRFSNGIYEPLWNKHFIDHIQFNVSEIVDVENRGAYYETTGVLRDVMQNHMFQMLAYFCMEPPGSFAPDEVRAEKAKVLQAVRILKPDDVPQFVVRGQYGPSLDVAGNVIKPGYRQSPGVNPRSNTETFAAYKMFIDNWRWEGVPIYLRSGKALWKRGTEIVVRFKKAPLTIFRGTAVESLTANRIVFHIQPRQAIETSFNSKIPGPLMQLQTVQQRFDYADTFGTARATGYEVMIYSCMKGDATLFSRTDLVEAAWRIAQPIMDYWAATPATEFPNYSRGTWGPPEAANLIEKDGRRWFEVVTTEVLEKCELFLGADPIFLRAIIMALRPTVVSPGEIIIHKDDLAREMYLICHGEVEILDDAGRVRETIREGGFFGEVGVLLSTLRTATVRAKTLCNLFVLDKREMRRILREQPQFAERIRKVANDRYDIALKSEQLIGTR